MKHACNFPACCYKTNHSGNLATHQRTHTGEKQYKCNECDFACATSGNLVTHKRTHTGENPYKCKECNFACTTSGNLVTHKRTHTGEKPYKCNECEYKCSDSSALVTHKRTHTGEKPYKCNECDFACTTSGHLVPHKRTHTGEKPYKCNECDYKCSRAEHLARHKQCWHTVDGIQRKKRRENALMECLQEHYTVDREQKINYSCFETQKKFARADGVIYLGNLTVIVECDEDQHKFYNDSVSCEVARMNNVNTALLCSGNGADLKILWLRVNPDGFSVD